MPVVEPRSIGSIRLRTRGCMGCRTPPGRRVRAGGLRDVV